MKQQPPRTPK